MRRDVCVCVLCRAMQHRMHCANVDDRINFAIAILCMRFYNIFFHFHFVCFLNARCCLLWRSLNCLNSQTLDKPLRHIPKHVHTTHYYRIVGFQCQFDR